MDNKGIGVFDSGVGGISVLLEMQKRFPGETFYYYGDNYNAPYGEKGKRELITLGVACIEKLLNYNVKAIVVACNTLSVNALKELKGYSPVPLYGVFPPLEKALINDEKTILLCTSATAIYYNGIKNKNLVVCPCKTLVKQIENYKNILDVNLTTDVPLHYKNDFDTVILGCTHYLFLKNKIFDHLKPRKIISGNEFTIDYMQKHQLLREKYDKNIKSGVFFVGDTARANEEFYNKVVKYCLL